MISVMYCKYIYTLNILFFYSFIHLHYVLWQHSHASFHLFLTATELFLLTCLHEHGYGIICSSKRNLPRVISLMNVVPLPRIYQESVSPQGVVRPYGRSDHPCWNVSWVDSALWVWDSSHVLDDPALWVEGQQPRPVQKAAFLAVLCRLWPYTTHTISQDKT